MRGKKKWQQQTEYIRSGTVNFYQMRYELMSLHQLSLFLTNSVVHIPFWAPNNPLLFKKFLEFYETCIYWRFYFSPSRALSWAKSTQCTLTLTISLTSLVLLFLLRLGLPGDFFPLDFLTKKPLYSYSFPNFPRVTPISLSVICPPEN